MKLLKVAYSELSVASQTKKWSPAAQHSSLRQITKFLTRKKVSENKNFIEEIFSIKKFLFYKKYLILKHFISTRLFML